MRRKWIALLLGVWMSLSVAMPLPPAKAAYDELPAFPGAEGFGYAATGGRGGEVYHVTSYELTGPGTFYDALMTAGTTPRTIVFDISGELTIPQIVARDKSKITIAGQTAPGDGVTIRGNNIRFIDCSDIVIRYMRFRLGRQDFNDDAMYFEDSRNVMIDHSSFSWGTDEVLSIKSKDYDHPKSKNITVQWSIISEGLLTHSMGGLVEMNTITMHHNLYAHNNDRNPKTKGPMDFVNNVVYNWGQYPYVAGGESGTKGYGNVVGNYFIAGINSENPEYAIVRGNENYSLYLENNRIDSNKNGKLDGKDTGGGMMETERPSLLVPERFEYPPVRTEEPEDAYGHVLDYAGASIARDAVDRRVTDGVRDQTGAIIGDENDVGGFPALARDTAPADTDRDGMPDAWETERGLDPNDPQDRNGDRNGDGYTNLEDYLNELAAPGFPEGYPLTPLAWSGTPFEPPVVADPESDPLPLPAMNGETLRNVTINDDSGNGAANAALWSVQADLQAGDFVAGDRMTGSKAYKFAAVPDEVRGSEWIRSAVGSRSATSEDLLTFYLSADADVYVAHDSRVEEKPGWLASSYEDTGAFVEDDQPVRYELYKKHYPAGSRVVMGPNGSTSKMNYFVVVRPTAEETAPPAGSPGAPAAELADGPSVSLQWPAVEGAAGYLIYRSSTMDPYVRAIGSSADAAFADDGAELGAVYRYQVSAVNGGGESALSEAAEVLAYDASLPAPPAPTGLAVAAARSLSVELIWSPAEGAAGYLVYRADVANGPFERVGYTQTTSFADSDVSPSSNYLYRVTATSAGGESAASGVVRATTKPPVELAPPPEGLTAVAARSGGFELAWQPSAAAESYNVYRRGAGDNGYSLIASGIVGTHYADDGVSAGVAGYSYQVTAVNEKGESTPSVERTVATPPPGKPQRLIEGLAGETFVGLIWTPQGGAVKYNIYRSSGGGSAEYVGSAKVDTFYDRSVEPGRHYVYFVKAENAAGESAKSNAVSVWTRGGSDD